MSGKVVHFEIPYDDGDRARAFYADTFGWQLAPIPDLGYTMVTTGPTDPEAGATEPGFINGGMFERTDEFPGKATNIVIDVDDIDATLAAVEQAGGKIQMTKQPVADMGFTAYFTDTEGNVVGLWQNA